jgi:serine/threonine protein kinase
MLELQLNDLYWVGKKVGRGGFATVRLARHHSSEKEAVLKIIPKVCAGRSYQEHIVEAGMFETAMSMTREQPQRNIVRYLDLLESPERYYVLMERLEGLQLTDALASKKWGQGSARAATLDILTALRHLHTVVGIYHRDLKLENLQYRSKDGLCAVSDEQDERPFGDLVLFDFGLARFVDQEWDGGYTGTKLYTAPEVSLELSREPSERAATGGYSPAVDLWAAGLILYVFVASTFPFDEDDVWETEYEKTTQTAIQHLDDDFSKMGSSIPRTLLDGLLNPDPEHRLDACAALEDPWLTRSWSMPPAVLLEPAEGTRTTRAGSEAGEEEAAGEEDCTPKATGTKPKAFDSKLFLAVEGGRRTRPLVANGAPEDLILAPHDDETPTFVYAQANDASNKKASVAF